MSPLSRLLAALALGCRAALALADPQAPRSLADDGYFEVAEPVAQGVWVIRQAQPFHLQPIGNVTLIEQSAGLVLVDSGGSPGSGRRIAKLVADLSPKPVVAIVITHWHGDHALGLPALLARWPLARVIATEATRAHLADPRTMNTPGRADADANAKLVAGIRGFAAYAEEQIAAASADWQRDGWRAAQRLFAQYAVDMDGALTLQPGESFRERLVLDDPENPAEALFVGRANTDGDAVVWLPKRRVLITGDLVVAPIPFGFGSYPGEWLASLEKLRAFDFAVLIPGHGAPLRERARLDSLAALLRDVRAQVTALAARGRTLDEAIAQVDMSAHAARYCGDDAWLRLWLREYWTAPIVRSAFKEAKGEPIVQDLRG